MRATGRFAEDEALRSAGRPSLPPYDRFELSTESDDRQLLLALGHVSADFRTLGPQPGWPTVGWWSGNRPKGVPIKEILTIYQQGTCWPVIDLQKPGG